MSSSSEVDEIWEEEDERISEKYGASGLVLSWKGSSTLDTEREEEQEVKDEGKVAKRV